MGLKGKKLLILGGATTEIPLVQRAKELGVYTIVTDMYDFKTSPAKNYADEAWNISWTNLDELSAKCKEENIGGILAGYSESHVEYMIKLSSLLNFPCYITKEQLEITRNKKKFKEVCKRNGVPVVRDYCDVADVDSFPVIVKPTDRGGSIGVSVAHNEEELKQAYSYAMEMSVEKNVVIEDFISDGFKFDVYYLIIDGKIIYLTCSDTITSDKGGELGIIQNAWLYPSKFKNAYDSGPRSNVEAMIKDMGIKNGHITFSSFVLHDKSFMFFETGFRLSGDQAFTYTNTVGKTNVLDAMITYAINGDAKEVISDMDKSASGLIAGKKCLTINAYAKGGEIKSIDGLERIEAMPDCTYVLKNVSVGDKCDDSHAILKKICQAVFVNDSVESLKEDADNMYSALTVTDLNDKDMIFDRIDSNVVIDWWN